MRRYIIPLLLVATLGCQSTTWKGARTAPSPTIARLEQDFADPPMKYRPHTRYWWFGGAVTRDELARELKGMKEQGLAGVEIQSTYDALPAVPSHQPVTYASPEWADRVAICIQEAAKLDMKVDLTPGSGWPYGGTWVNDEYAGQSLGSETIPVTGPGLREAAFQPLGPVVAVTLARASADDPTAPAVEPAQVVTDRVQSNGQISVSVPEGEWLLTCFWAKLGGFGPHKRANKRETGPVLDHMSAAAMDFHLDHCVQPVLDRVGNCVGDTFESLFIDSWELGRPTWTTDFLQQFRARRGYDLIPYLPVIARYDKDDSPNTNAVIAQILWDYDQTLRDLAAENCYGELTRWCHQHGLKSRSQAHGSPTDWVDSYGVSDIPEFEVFENKRPGAVEAPNAAHVYSHQVVSCESFTWLTEHWRMTLADMRRMTDTIFVCGANQLVFHGYSYSPPEAGFPGWDFYASCEIDHNNTFWPYIRPLTDYISRNSVLLRSGRPVVDVCVYGTNENLLGPSLLSDRVTDRVLCQLAKMDEDRLAIGFGSYRLLIIDSPVMPLKTLGRIQSLVRSGLTLIAVSPPSEVPTFKNHDAQTTKLRRIVAGLLPDKTSAAPRKVGKGTTYLVARQDIASVLENLGVQPQLKEATDKPQTRWLHRQGAGYDLFLLNNPSKENTIRQTFSFRAKGCLEIWNAHTGKIEPFPHRVDGDRVVADIEIGPQMSRLVMIRRDKTAGGSASVPTTDQSIAVIEEPWQVQFRHIDGRQPFEKDFPSLIDWTGMDDLKFFAGTAIYRTQIDLPSVPRGNMFLDLGQVCDLASVSINGKPAGIVFESPFRVDVTGLLHTGKNAIEVKIANRTENGIPAAGAAWKGEGKWPGYFFVNKEYKDYDPTNAQVHPSGLLGPVQLFLQQPSPR